MKLPSSKGGVITIKSNKKMAQKFYKSSLKNRRGTYAITVQAGEPEWMAEVEVVNDKRPGPAREVEEREINGKKFKFDTSLGKELEDKIVDVISVNMDAFAWSSADMPGVDPDFLCDRLTMDERVKPVVQRRRNFNEDKPLVIQEETQKLVVIGHVREIQYPEWLTNIVLVKKANRK